VLFADLNGESGLLGVVMIYAPLECVCALAANQPLWAELIARGRYADQQRYFAGITAGLGGAS